LRACCCRWGRIVQIFDEDSRRHERWS
jgi:hypothetical protein